MKLKGPPRPLEAPKGSELKPIGFWLGKGANALEVAVYDSPDRQPSAGMVLEAWKHRVQGRATPVLAIVTYPTDTGQKTSVCGPTGDNPPVIHDLSPEVIERVAQSALEEPDRHAALRFLKPVLHDAQSPIPGLRNEGFLATHELVEGAKQWLTWPEFQGKAEAAAKKQGRDLVRALGFNVHDTPGPVSFLTAGDRKVAVAALLEKDEVPEQSHSRFSGYSPISYALDVATNENLDYVLVTSGNMIRLYPARTNVGVGQRGRTETFIEAHLGVLPTEKLAYLWYLFSSEALAKGGRLEKILEASRDHAAELGKRLRERIYDEVVPRLATAIATARRLRNPTAADLEETYQVSLTLLFRLLFVAYAEDKELLPYKSNELYRARSLKQKAKELLKLSQSQTAFDSSTTHWEEVWRVFEAVDEGRQEWGVPPYNGGLFSSDPKISKTGATLKSIRLPNTEFGIALRQLLIDNSPEGLGPVDFRSLGVREFGTIYEGLLESELARAETDLAIDREGRYKPRGKGEEVAVREGAYYLSRSGARKSSGSYFTKSFAVEHLLDHALEPALDAHLKRLDALDDAKAAEAFFDFRVADIAMGSGHFLVGAVDRIEKKLSGYLTSRNLPGVAAELARLRAEAIKALGTLAIGIEIEDAQLLRRQVARRCVYGVDLKPGAVELARVSIWIHTFVPGLPLSLLDQHLVQGNSLVGIATREEALGLLEGGVEEDKKAAKGKGKVVSRATTLFEGSAREVMANIAETMIRVAKLGDATAAEVKNARQEWQAARKAAEPWRVLMDVLAASRLDEKLKHHVPAAVDAWAENPESILSSKTAETVTKVFRDLRPFHFPVAFPEVFWKDRPGFDVLLGNPPWEESTVEESKFWARVSPGLGGLPQHAQEELKAKLRKERPDLVQRYEQDVAQAETVRSVLTSGAFPGMGTGDPDLYKAFSWRFWELAGLGGRVGVVLPRSAF